MKDIFEDLCCMDRFMADSKLMKNEKYRAKLKELSSYKEDFLMALDEVQKNQFDDINRCQHELNYIERTKSFTHGFKLGMFMYREAFGEK